MSRIQVTTAVKACAPTSREGTALPEWSRYARSGSAQAWTEITYCPLMQYHQGVVLTTTPSRSSMYVMRNKQHVCLHAIETVKFNCEGSAPTTRSGPTNIPQAPPMMRWSICPVHNADRRKRLAPYIVPPETMRHPAAQGHCPIHAFPISPSVSTTPSFEHVFFHLAL